MRWENYVEKISENNLSNPFTPLYWRYGVEEIRRISRHEDFHIGNEVMLRVHGNQFRYAVIDYIVEIITFCELHEEKVFLLKDHRGLCFSHAFIFNPKQMIHVDRFGMKKNLFFCPNLLVVFVLLILVGVVLSILINIAS